MHPDISIKEIAIILYIGKKEEEPLNYRNTLTGTAKELLETSEMIEFKYRFDGADYYKLTENGCRVYEGLVGKIRDINLNVHNSIPLP